MRRGQFRVNLPDRRRGDLIESLEVVCSSATTLRVSYQQKGPLLLHERVALSHHIFFVCEAKFVAQVNIKYQV